MHPIQQKLAVTDWNAVTESLHQNGYAMISGLLTVDDCQNLIRGYDSPGLYRKTVNMERYRFGSGEYKYFRYPLPRDIQLVRETVYPKLAPVANAWMQILGMDKHFPEHLHELHALCARNGQTHPTPLILKYNKGGYNTLHQDLYGDIFFPIQLVLFLNEPGQDYTGGEFVLTQQNPRAQSKVTVLNPKRGDMLMFTTQFRPVKGTKGHYRANVKHGVSELHGGERHTLGIIFHDAVS